MSGERIIYERIYYVEGVGSNDYRKFTDVEEALAFACEKVRRGERASIFHHDREVKGEA